MSNAWRTLALLSLAVLVVSMATDANAARRSALGGNQFIDDSDDMFAFPQLMMKYKNSAIFDFAPSPSYDEYEYDMQGRGSVTFGDNWAWQFNTGRADYLENTAWWSFGGTDRLLDIMGGGNINPGIQWWDVGVATDFGNVPVGFTVSWASWNRKFTPEGEDPTVDESQSMISFQLGATWLFDAEWVIEFGTGSTKDNLVDASEDPDGKTSLTEFALAVRGDEFEMGGIDWRWFAAFATASMGNDVDGLESSSMTGFRGNFGPVWGVPGDWLVASYLYFEYGTEKEPYGAVADDKETYSYFTFPGYNFAMEYYITRWLVARGSVFSHYASETYKIEGTGDEGESSDGEYKEKYFDFFWTVGLGLDKRTWGLDIALEEDQFHTGYIFSNSDDVDQAFATITAWLRW